MTDTNHETDLDTDHVGYFIEQLTVSNAEYWDRIGPVDLVDKTVLDVGCGQGALSIDAARRGAKRVVGVDIDSVLIDFAQTNLERNYAQYASIISFQEDPLENIAESFDVVVSKDSFEHIADLSAMMAMIDGRLKSGGLLLAGFSPLYFSPFGDHNRYWTGKPKIPWLPAILPESVLFRLASRRRNAPVKSADDVGLNKMTPAEFRDIVAAQGWEIIAWHTNRGGRSGMSLMSSLAKHKRLEKYFTVNIYATLRKPVGQH